MTSVGLCPPGLITGAYGTPLNTRKFLGKNYALLDSIEDEESGDSSRVTDLKTGNTYAVKSNKSLTVHATDIKYESYLIASMSLVSPDTVKSTISRLLITS